MKTRNVLFTIILTLLAGASYAGLYQPFPVDVNLDFFQANGDQISARKDPNDDVFIGCGNRVIDDGLGGAVYFGFCQATDAEGDTIACSTQNPALVEAISATSAYAFITFSWDQNTLECTRVGFSTQSFYLPKPNYHHK